MATITSPIAGFLHQARVVRRVVATNIDGVSHAESLVAPQPAGNSLNWVMGHLLWSYDQLLPFLAQQPTTPGGWLDRYARGAQPLASPADALPFDELARNFDEAANRVEAGLASLQEDALDRPAPGSPSNDPEETVGSLLSTIMFHQAYHAGQAGVLRRVSGKAGAIR